SLPLFYCSKGLVKGNAIPSFEPRSIVRGLKMILSIAPALFSRRGLACFNLRLPFGQIATSNGERGSGATVRRRGCACYLARRVRIARTGEHGFQHQCITA